MVGVGERHCGRAGVKRSWWSKGGRVSVAEVGSILRIDNRTARLLCQLRKWRRISAERAVMLSMGLEGQESTG